MALRYLVVVYDWSLWCRLIAAEDACFWVLFALNSMLAATKIAT